MLPIIVVSFDPGDTEKVVPIPVVPGFIAIGKTCMARLIDPAPAATLPASVSATVGYEATGSAFFVDPVFAQPMFI
jgi:hypothetical protein